MMLKEMKETAVFLVGSRYFFGGIDGFSSKDHDYVHLMSGWYLPQRSLLFRDGDVDRFLYPDDGLLLIDECIVNEDPLTTGKFLVPEFCKHIGAELEDIMRLESLFMRLEGFHSYEKTIYLCYKNNGCMRLADAQKMMCYQEYVKARKSKTAL